MFYFQRFKLVLLYIQVKEYSNYQIMLHKKEILKEAIIQHNKCVEEKIWLIKHYEETKKSKPWFKYNLAITWMGIQHLNMHIRDSEIYMKNLHIEINNDLNRELANLNDDYFNDSFFNEIDLLVEKHSHI